MSDWKRANLWARDDERRERRTHRWFMIAVIASASFCTIVESSLACNDVLFLIQRDAP